MLKYYIILVENVQVKNERTWAKIVNNRLFIAYLLWRKDEYHLKYSIFSAERFVFRGIRVLT